MKRPKRVRKDWQPLARTDEILVEEMDGEILIYDLKRDRSHCLNGPASQLWRHCDGDHTVEDLETLIAAETEGAPRKDLVRYGLEQLARCRLLDGDFDSNANGASYSRRELIRKVGIGAAVAAIMVPPVSSIVAPTPADAASPCSGSTGKDLGCPCTTSGQCSSGCCKGTCVSSGCD